jgi:spore coat polysaccharide biosynthesis protein SpsF
MKLPGIVVLARMSSSRLPGKVLTDLAGQPLLQRVLNRLRRVSGCADIVLATSDQVEDDAIANFAQHQGVSIYRGDLVDVMARCLAAGETFDIDPVVRISGDSPFICPDIIERALALSRENAASIVTNLFPRSFPPGMSVEVIPLDMLRHMLRQPLAPDEREHVTTYIYHHPDEFSIINFGAETEDLTNVHLAVDTETDLSRARALYAGGVDAETPLADVIRAVRAWPVQETRP